MAPTPQESCQDPEGLFETQNMDVPVINNKKIVISGMSGLFPQAQSVKELSEILYNKVDPISSDLPWEYKHPEVTKHIGSASALDRFDAQFFTVYHRLGHYMDPMSRKILEQTYQAIYDAGLSPAHLHGKKVAVFMGVSFTETENKGMVDVKSKFGLGIVGCSKTMYANRVSYWLNVKGPSVAIDELECSATVALQEAYSALKRGVVEAAIVGASSLSLLPHLSIYHRRMAAVSSDGKTKSFDKNSDGYALSDGLGVLFLQNADQALRVYAELKYVKNEFISLPNCGINPKFGYTRDTQTAANFLKQFYKEAQVAPQAVEYVEALGTAVPEADKAELEAIADVFCEDRVEPLLVGSVSSNIGHTEAASGISAITKVLLAYHTGKVAANLHCSEPRQDVVALRDGRLRIVTEHESLSHSYVGINGMSLSGVNSHVLLQGQYKPKDLSAYKSSIPHLVTISGRQESAVKKIFDDLKSRPIDAEEIALFHNIHSENTSGHLGRGFNILDTDENYKTISLHEKVEYFDNAGRPLWFVYSGMGSQWATMGAQLMRIPIFAAAIERCHEVLKPKGLDIVKIITSSDKTTFDNILHSFVGIAAVQIGLTDILHALGLVPDGIIGHSVGELGCAYADGCLSAEEMVLAAYSRGLVSLETPLIRGSMAAVGLGYEQISKMCPPEVDVACHNSTDSSTISGPADVMREFVAQLTAKGIFAKEVPCSNIAYHSRYIADAGPNLLKYLKEVIKHPKQRTQKWISSSVPQDKWDDELAKYCSAEYQTNNLLSPVLFDETSKLIPSNAVLVEVAPHGLLQAILKRSMPSSCQHVPLTRRGHPDNALFLLQAIGNIYMEGYKLNLQALYPKIQFPVSTTTPMLSHLPEWVHSELWTVVNTLKEDKVFTATCKFIISMHDEEHSYLKGYNVQGKTCYPFSAALTAVWDTLAMCLDMPRKSISVQFTDVQLYAQPILHSQSSFELTVAVQRGTGKFEVTSEHSLVASGTVSRLFVTTNSILRDTPKPEEPEFGSHDVYKLLQERNYVYSEEFCNIKSVKSSLNEAKIAWCGNWVTIIDGMLQLSLLRQPLDVFSRPSFIRRVQIDIKAHYNLLNLDSKNLVTATLNDIHKNIRCGGIIIEDLKFDQLPAVTKDAASLQIVSALSDQNTNLDVRTSAVTLQSSQIGKLESLHWVTAPQPDLTHDTVQVHYAGLNMFDVKKATGVSQSNSNSYAMDFSGTTKRGDRVMGIVQSGAASSQVTAQPQLLWPVPKHWSLEDAATVPLAYAQAFYCLRIKGNMVPGMTVLVNGGAGALGQAVIAVALAHNCNVFATVRDARKKHFLQKLFPQLKDENILSSHGGTFSDAVLLATEGKGCDIIVSCVKGDLKDASLKCCGFSGRLIDTVQIEEREDYYFGMFLLTRQRSYMSADISSIFSNDNDEVKKVLHSSLSEGIARGYVRPISRLTYAPHEVARAFRILASSQHRGRVLLRMQDNVPHIQQRVVCTPGHSHITFWDNDDIGVHLVDRLISRGAKTLFIHSSKPTTYQQFKIESWRKQGIDVVLSSVDLTAGVATVLKSAAALAPVEGIFVIVNTTNYGNNNVTSILNNVDLDSRLLCPQLRYFLVVSTSDVLGQEMCLSRAKNGFVAKHLDLFTLAKEKALSDRNAVEAIERALISTHVVTSARTKQTQPLSLLERVAALADIQVIEDTDSEDTLINLGMAVEKIPVIKAFLSDHYNTEVPEHLLEHLTIQKLNEIEKSVTDVNKPIIKGLNMFFSNICSDELQATAEVVVLPTLFNDINLSKHELDVNQKFMCIVPGMEGHHQRFQTICQSFKLPALVLQTGFDLKNETIPQTAQRLAETLIKKGMVQDNFYLFGHESGVMVALELAAILENKGHVGTVFCAGYSPEELQLELAELLKDYNTEDEMHDAVLRHMFTLITNGDTAGLDNALRDATTWSDKVYKCVECLKGRVPHSKQYVRELIDTALDRIEQVRRYNSVTRPLRSRLVLLRAATSLELSPHSSLQKYSQQPITIYQLNSCLSQLIDDLQCSAIVNKHLDTETRERYENQNHCVAMCYSNRFFS